METQQPATTTKNKRQSEKQMELRPDNHLIDPNFEKYKLSLEQLPTITSQFRFGLAITPPAAGLFSYAKTRCISTHNYLIIDPFYTENVFFVDATMKIRRSHVHQSRVDPAQFVYKLESSKEEVADKDQLPPSLAFPQSTVCVASDGCGVIMVLNTGERKARECDKWSTVYRDDRTPPCVILDCRYRSLEGVGESCLELLVVRFEERESSKEKCDEVTVVVLEWMRLHQSAANSGYQLIKSRLFEGKSYPDYAAIVSENGLSLASAAPFTLISGGWDDDDDMDVDNVVTPPPSNAAKFKWKQTSEDVTIMIKLTTSQLTTKQHIVCSISPKRVSIGVRPDLGSEPVEVVAGDLYLESDPEASNWSVEAGELIVCIQKKLVNRTWPQLIEGEDVGEFVADDEQMTRAHDALKHLTTDPTTTEGADDDDDEYKMFNSEQLEECDSFFQSNATLKYFDAATNSFTHSVDISSLKWLFNARLAPTEPLALVLRHDVDAVLWQANEPDQYERVWRHQSTFNALGYVHASKTNIKYTACAPDSSYAALCECQRRVYIYRQPSPLVNSALKNRSLGKQVRKISKQQVAVLDTQEDIHGFCAANHHLYILTSSQLSVFKMACDVGA